MITKLRNLKSHPITRILLFLIAICFVFLWGGSQGLRMIGSSQDITVATVGTKYINAKELQYELARVLHNINTQTGQKIDFKQARHFGLDLKVLNNLIQNTLIDLEAEELKIAVSNQFIVNYIKKQKAFLDAEEKFSKPLLYRYIGYLGFDKEKDYVAYLKKEILRKRLLSTLVKQFKLPQATSQLLQRWGQQTRTIEAMVIDPSALKIENNVTEQKLREHYSKNIQHFIDPQRITFTVLVVDTSKQNITVTNQEVDSMYQIAKDKQFKDVAIEQAKITIRKQIMQDKIKEKNIELHNEIATDFEDNQDLPKIAAKYKLEYKKLNKVAIQDENISDFDRETIRLAFNQENKEPSTFEQSHSSKDKVFMVFMESKTKARQLNFQEAIAKVKKNYTRILQLHAANQLISDIKEQLRQENNFSSVSSIYNLPIITLVLNRNELLEPADLRIESKFIDVMFKLKIGSSALIPFLSKEKKQNLLLVNVNKISTPDKITDSKVKKQLAQSFNRELGNDILSTYINYLYKKYPVEINKKYFKNK